MARSARLGIDLAVAGEVGHGEQHVAQLVGQAGLIDVAGRELGPEFAQFLLDLVDDRTGLASSRSPTRAARFWIFSARRSAGRARATPSRAPAGPRRRLGRPFGGLAGFPGHGLGLGSGDPGVAEHVRMAVDHLVGNGRGHVGEAEGAGLVRHLGVVDDLQQEIAQFFLERAEVVAFDGVGHLVGFLDRVRRDGPEGLVDVPRAAMLAVAQPRHDGEKAGHRLARQRFRRGTFGRHKPEPRFRLSYNIYYDKYR